MGSSSSPSQYEIVEKATWGFVESLGIPGLARRGQVARTITETVVTALVAGQDGARLELKQQQAAQYRAPLATRDNAVEPSHDAMDEVRESLRAELNRYLTEDLPKQLHQSIGAHVRIGLSQALEAGARSARVDHTPAEEDNRVHMAGSTSTDSVESAAARMQRITGTTPPILGDAALLAKSAACGMRAHFDTIPPRA